VRDEKVDKVLKMASGVAPQLQPALLKRIADSINSSLRPVRPLPPTWMLSGGLTLICVAVAVAAAASTGFYGIENLSLWERALIFSTLGILVWVAGKEFVSQLVPGSRPYFSVGAFLTISTAALLGVFALVFRDYHIDHFISAGIACLLTGLLLAIPAALLSWLLLRRGFCCGGTRGRRTRGPLRRDDVGASLRQFPGAACTAVAHSGGACERGSRSVGGVGAAWAFDPREALTPIRTPLRRDTI